MTSRHIPPLLEPYLASLPPEAALVIVSGILGATTNWLILRYLHSYLSKQPPPLPAPLQAETSGRADGSRSEGVVSVVLLSFMRHYVFWRDGAGRLVRL